MTPEAAASRPLSAVPDPAPPPSPTKAAANSHADEINKKLAESAPAKAAATKAQAPTKKAAAKAEGSTKKSAGPDKATSPKRKAGARQTVAGQTHEGQPVLTARLVIRNTGDGLSSAMDMDPVVLHNNDEVYVVIKAHIVDHAFPNVKDTNGVARVHIAKATEGIILDPEMVRQIDPQLAEMRRRVAAAEAAENGAIPGFDDV